MEADLKAGVAARALIPEVRDEVLELLEKREDFLNMILPIDSPLSYKTEDVTRGINGRTLDNINEDILNAITGGKAKFLIEEFSDKNSGEILKYIGIESTKIVLRELANTTSEGIKNKTISISYTGIWREEKDLTIRGKDTGRTLLVLENQDGKKLIELNEDLNAKVKKPEDLQKLLDDGDLKIDIDKVRPSTPEEKVTISMRSKMQTESSGMFSKLFRIGSNIPAFGAAISALAAGSIGHAHDVQRDHALALHEKGVLNDEALNTYHELNRKIEASLYGDLALSTVDPTGASIVMTLGVEANARNEFNAWLDTHAPDLPQEDIDALSMSLFGSQSSRSKMLYEAAQSLPKNTEGAPEVLHAAIEKNNAYRQAASEVVPGNILAAEKMLEKQAALLDEMNNLMSDPENAATLLSITPISDRLEYARALAQSEVDPNRFKENHSEIAAYVEEYEASWTGLDFELSTDDVLKENPELLNNYILERNGLVSHEQNTSEPEIASVPQGHFDSVAGDAGLIQDAAAAGVSIDPALIAASQQTTPNQNNAAMTYNNVQP